MVATVDPSQHLMAGITVLHVTTGQRNSSLWWNGEVSTALRRKPPNLRLQALLPPGHAEPPGRQPRDARTSLPTASFLSEEPHQRSGAAARATTLCLGSVPNWDHQREAQHFGRVGLHRARKDTCWHSELELEDSILPSSLTWQGTCQQLSRVTAPRGVHEPPQMCYTHWFGAASVLLWAHLQTWPETKDRPLCIVSRLQYWCLLDRGKVFKFILNK